MLTGATLLTELLEDEVSEVELLEDRLKDESLELLTGSDDGALELIEDDAAELAGGVLDDPPPPQPASINAIVQPIEIIRGDFAVILR